MKKDGMASGRRDVLKIAGAGLVGAAIPAVAAGAQSRGEAPGDAEAAESEDREELNNGPKPVYLHGCGWNHELPGIYGELCLSFDVRAELNGTGLGTLRDDVHPEVNSQFEIRSAKKHGNEYTLEGAIIASRDPGMVGMAVKIVSEKLGNGKGKAAITVGSEDGSLVVIAIIAVLISLLVPADQGHHH